VQAKNEGLTVVPSVVIDQSRSIRHPSDLVSVIPPTHHDRVLLRVHSQPVVRLPEIIDDVLASILVSRREHDRRGRVRVGGDPGAVEDEEDEEDEEVSDDEETRSDSEDSVSRGGGFRGGGGGSRGFLGRLFGWRSGRSVVGGGCSGRGS